MEGIHTQHESPQGQALLRQELFFGSPLHPSLQMGL